MNKDTLESNLKESFYLFLDSVLKDTHSECNKHPSTPLDYHLDLHLDCGACREELLNHRKEN